MTASVRVDLGIGAPSSRPIGVLDDATIAISPVTSSLRFGAGAAWCGVARPPAIDSFRPCGSRPAPQNERRVCGNGRRDEAGKSSRRVAT